MLISHKHKFIVVNIPKTGCNSRVATLQHLGVIDVYGDGPKNSSTFLHNTFREIVKFHFQTDVYYSHYYKWGMVRNPWDFYVSSLNYNKVVVSDPAHIDHNRMLDWWCKCNKDDHIALKNIIQATGKVYTPQIEYLIDNNNNIVVDHIARFENIDDEHKKFCEKVGIDPIPPLKHSNKSSRANQKHFREYYTQELIDMVAEKEKGVIELMGYTI